MTFDGQRERRSIYKHQYALTIVAETIDAYQYGGPPCTFFLAPKGATEGTLEQCVQ